MIGTNDIAGGTYDPTATPAAYAALLSQIIAVDGTTRILVTTIPPQQGSTPEANVVDFNGKLPAIWDAFDATNPSAHVLRADVFAALGSAWSSANFSANTVHLNPTGYAAMLGAIQAGLPNLAAPNAPPLPPMIATVTDLDEERRRRRRRQAIRAARRAA